MAESDFTVCSDSLSTATLADGVTAGIAPPSGGGSFVHGFNSLSLASGARAKFTNQVNFAPMALGGSIRGVLQRGPSGGPTGFSPFLFIGAQGASVNDSAYLIGLSDGEPSKIVLKKGTLAAGVPDAEPDPAGNGILLRSSRDVAIGEWVHVRLDMIVNANGDVILQVFENDLAVNALGTAPDWQPIAGMEGPLSASLGLDGFVDDALQVATASPPLTSGRAGFGMQVSDVTRRGYFDHIEVIRQTA